MAKSTASTVLFEPAPAITGARPAEASMQTSITRLCSSWLSVGDSPVVPTGTRHFVPSVTCQSTNARNVSSSNSPDMSNGVTIAVIDPRSAERSTINNKLPPEFAR